MWERYIGKQHETFHCLVCKAAEIKSIKYDVADVQPIVMGGDISISKLRPVCAHCNRRMGAMHMREYCARYPAGESSIVDCPCKAACTHAGCPCIGTMAKANPGDDAVSRLAGRLHQALCGCHRRGWVDSDRSKDIKLLRTGLS